MVHSIRGIVTFKSSEAVGIENGGIEWQIDTTATSLSALPGIGQEAKIYTHLHHKEDQMRLYGFATSEERTVFLALLTVNGVGPSLARKILSGTTPDGFNRALATEDLAMLSQIPGLGKKTAQKIVLHLRGKLADDASADSSGGDEKEVVDSLTAMGFDAASARKAVRKVLDDPELIGMDAESKEREILRRCIVSLSS